MEFIDKTLQAVAQKFSLKSNSLCQKKFIDNSACMSVWNSKSFDLYDDGTQTFSNFISYMVYTD